MDKTKWSQFTKTLDAILIKHNVYRKADQVLLTEETNHNRTLLTDLWGDITKCFQRAANNTIPSIIVNEDTSINSHNHGRIRDRVAWANHELVKDINWLRKQLHYCNKYLDQLLLPKTIIDINIHISRINSKHGTHIAYINNTWN